MPQNVLFDINKFCSNPNYNNNSCNPSQYKKLVTSTNNPTMSRKLLYSQYLRTRRFKQVQNNKPDSFFYNYQQPMHVFPTGQVLPRSNI